MVLPVQLQLYGNKENNSNKLWWQTQNETGIKEYVIERSADGRNNFKLVGSIQYAGNGTENRYLYNDEKPLQGNNYYRLKIITNNGGTGYSNIVRIKSSLSAVYIYPNPAQEQITVDLRNKPQSSYTIRLYSSSGLQVYNQVINSTSMRQVVISRNSLNTGVYLVTVTDTITGEQDFEKIIFR